MAAYVKFQSFLEAAFEKKHNLGADTLKVLLCLTAPSASLDAVKADLTDELGTAFGYTAGGPTVGIASSSQSGGTYTLVSSGDPVITASGGSVGPFRYAVLWNDTAASDELISYYDYGASLALNDGEALTVDFGASIFSAT